MKYNKCPKCSKDMKRTYDSPYGFSDIIMEGSIRSECSCGYMIFDGEKRTVEPEKIGDVMGGSFELKNDLPTETGAYWFFDARYDDEVSVRMVRKYAGRLATENWCFDYDENIFWAGPLTPPVKPSVSKLFPKPKTPLKK